MKQKIEAFFKGVEEAWSAVPGYVKVFLYSTISTTFGLWVMGTLEWREVVIIVVSNLGLYGGPRVIADTTRKLM